MIADPITKIRVLKAKVGELEAYVRENMDDQEKHEHAWLAADIALVADIVADVLIEQVGGME